MPLEIRELVIKATVSNTSPNASMTGQASEETNINEIVDRVLEIIKEKTER